MFITWFGAFSLFMSLFVVSFYPFSDYNRNIVLAYIILGLPKTFFSIILNDLNFLKGGTIR